MQPVTILNMPNAEYHKRPAMSSTAFKTLARSPAHYHAGSPFNPAAVRKEPTAAMKIGTAWHTAVFEPARFDAEYVRIPDGIDRRTKEGKAFFAELADGGLEPMTADAFDQIVAMRDSAHAHPVAAALLSHSAGIAEASIFWTDDDTGVPCKIRPDWMIPPCDLFEHGAIIDGKTCEDASPEGFARAVWSWQYQFQAAFYSDGFQKVFDRPEPPVFLFLAQEKEAPFATALYRIDDALINYGRAEYRRMLSVLSDCLARDHWPAYSQTVQVLQMPAWVDKIINSNDDEIEDISYVA